MDRRTSTGLWRHDGSKLYGNSAVATRPSVPVGTSRRKGVQMGVIGSSGLPIYAGYVSAEFLKDLQWDQGKHVIREMMDNDPVVGAVLMAYEMLMRRTEFYVDPNDANPSQSQADADADLIDSARHDMYVPFADTLSEIMNFMAFGFMPLEIGYKRRDGINSKFNDGSLGWSGWYPRSPETIKKWERDPVSRQITGMWQLAPPDWDFVMIPMEKVLLFRTRSRNENPEGMALDPQTPIPTPDGWKVMDDLHPGSKVFDEQGRIRYVTARADWDNRPCYRLTFSDGTEIIADEAHQWPTTLVWERSNKRAATIRNTSEIVRTLKNSNGVSNHGIAWAKAVDYPEQALPVPPYVLGLWLGDGYTNAMRIACHVDDAAETVANLEQDGFKAVVEPNGVESLGRSIRVMAPTKWASDGPSHAMRVAGVIGNKHIPAAYLRGSIDQRLSLLAGLMDSDGTVDKDGRCEFVNTNMALIHGVAELVRSLGCGAKVSLRKRRGHVSSGGIHLRHDSYCVKFTPDWNPFRLVRKSNKIKGLRARKQHYIVKAERVEPRRTVCIEVDSPSHLFLAGTGMIPTHNSTLRNAFWPWHFKKHMEVIEGIGIERDLVGYPVMYVPENILSDKASDAERSSAQAYRDLLSEIKRDSNEGALLPMAFDRQSGNQLYKLELLTSGGQRQIDVGAVIERKSLEIATSVMADFIMLGQGQVGSYALSESKTTLFTTALGAWLNMITDVIQQQGVERLAFANGVQAEYCPQFKHGDPIPTDPEVIANFLKMVVNPRTGAGIQVDTSMTGKPAQWIMDVIRGPKPVPGGRPPAVDPSVDEVDPDSAQAKIENALETYIKSDAFRANIAEMAQREPDQYRELYAALRMNDLPLEVGATNGSNGS